MALVNMTINYKDTRCVMQSASTEFHRRVAFGVPKTEWSNCKYGNTLSVMVLKSLVT